MAERKIYHISGALRVLMKLNVVLSENGLRKAVARGDLNCLRTEEGIRLFELSELENFAARRSRRAVA